MILLCLRKSPIFKSGTNVIQQNAHALCLYSFLDCIFIVAWDCCLFVPWVFGDTSKTDKKLTVLTLFVYNNAIRRGTGSIILLL